MEIFYAVCAGLVTLAAVWALISLVMTLQQIKATARAVEYLVINANDRVESTRALFNAVDSVTGSLRSGWLKVFQLAAGLITGWKSGGQSDGCRKF